MLVYVVGFAPSDDNHSVGGFDWFPISERDAAVARVQERLAEGDGYSVTFVPLHVPGDLRGDAVTRWIDERLDLIEVGR